MKTISDFLYRRSTLWILIVLTVVTFVYPYLLMAPTVECYSAQSEGGGSFGLSFGFSYDTVNEALRSMNDEAISCFRRLHLVWDNIFALLYGLMYAGWLSYVYKPWASKVKLLNLFPFLQSIFDWLENLQLSSLAYKMATEGLITETGVQVGSTFSMIKWTVSILMFLVLIIGIVLRIRRGIIHSEK